MRPNSPVVESALDTAPVIPEHELLRPIAAGAYGQVWLARSALGTLRAVKIVRRDRFDRAEDFEREWRGLQRFEPVSRTHEALVDILQIGRQDDWFYYVMELADDASTQGKPPTAETTTRDRTPPPDSRLPTPHSAFRTPHYTPLTLRQMIRDRGALPATEVVSLGHRLASALAHLHAQGLVHRDVKPSNILFAKGQSKLADVGLVAAVDDARSLVGTPGYIPPEGPGTHQADIYSLGKVLYETAFGKDRQEFPQLPPDLAARPEHAQMLELNEIIVKACAQDPRQRYRSAEDLLAELEGLQCGKSVRRKRRLEHHWAIYRRAGLGAGLLGVLVAAMLLDPRGRGDRDLHSASSEVNTLVEQGNLAVLSQTPDRVNAAIAYFSKAIELDRKFTPAHFGLFRAYLEQQEPRARNPKLRATADKLKELAPRLAETHVASAFIKWWDWQFRDAVGEARLATTLHAGTQVGRGWAHKTLGFCLLFTGNAPDAAEEFRSAERLLPTDPDVQHALGHPYYVQRRFKEALAHYEKSIALVPQHAFGYHIVGEVYEATGDFMKAIDAFEMDASLLGKDDAATKRYFEALREAAREGGAKGYFGKHLEFALKAPAADPYDIAYLYACLDERDKAYEWLEKAIAQHTDCVAESLMFQAGWDHHDERFKALARKAGLMW